MRVQISPPQRLGARAPVTSYGNGGFKFAGMRHQGSLLILPGGIYAWNVQRMDELRAASLTLLRQETAKLEFFLLGTGATQIFPAAALRELFAAEGLSLEAMDTGAACRTYNLLLADGRAFAAGLIAV